MPYRRLAGSEARVMGGWLIAETSYFPTICYACSAAMLELIDTPAILPMHVFDTYAR